jgi:hypothetical protein
MNKLNYRYSHNVITVITCLLYVGENIGCSYFLPEPHGKLVETHVTL